MNQKKAHALDHTAILSYEHSRNYRDCPRFLKILGRYHRSQQQDLAYTGAPLPVPKDPRTIGNRGKMGSR